MSFVEQKRKLKTKNISLFFSEIDIIIELKNKTYQFEISSLIRIWITLNEFLKGNGFGRSQVDKLDCGSKKVKKLPDL